MEENKIEFTEAEKFILDKALDAFSCIVSDTKNYETDNYETVNYAMVYNLKVKLGLE